MFVDPNNIDEASKYSQTNYTTTTTTTTTTTYNNDNTNNNRHNKYYTNTAFCQPLQEGGKGKSGGKSLGPDRFDTINVNS